MKEIMAAESSLHEQGVPSFHYSPADIRFPLLFELNRPLDDLEEMLLTGFAGRTEQIGRSRWLGPGQPLSFHHCQAIKAVLIFKADSTHYSRRAAEEMSNAPKRRVCLPA